MWRRNKIIAISNCIENDKLFTVGLGRDGKAYLWDSVRCVWVLHKAMMMEAPTDAEA